MYHATTKTIRVSVEPSFLEDQSEPLDDHFVWAYRVRIENDGRDPVRLCDRRWTITDSFGVTQEIKGSGVIGQQPIIDPGESFEYTSGTPLRTASGIMQGAYRMESAQGTSFDVTIPAFSLDSPYEQAMHN
jgi:ApaG protein